MVNVRGIEPSAGAINPARDSAEQTESVGYGEDGSVCEEKRERRNRAKQRTTGHRHFSLFIVLTVPSFIGTRHFRSVIVRE